MSLVNRIRKYHFELIHLSILFMILMLFQLVTSYIQKLSIREFLNETRAWYQKDFADRFANLSATSLELLLETTVKRETSHEDEIKIVQAFNIILSQQLLQQHVEEVCLMVPYEGRILTIDNGQVLYNYLFNQLDRAYVSDRRYGHAVRLFMHLQDELRVSEQTQSELEGRQTFHVFVPFVPKGEFVGAFYMKCTPAFQLLTQEIMTSYQKTSLLFLILILLGFAGMFYISTSTLRERDATQQLLFEERECQLTQDLNHQKEALFAKRIYHTHHKAEKVMGFIKQDLRSISKETIDEIKYRVIKYANFISRVIYDMKWYDPPLQTIRGPIFRTDLNEVIRFLVQHLFLRLSDRSEQFEFRLHLDDALPSVPVNEFVVWEVIEPLLQNSIDHGGEGCVIIDITTRHSIACAESVIEISDNGRGIQSDLLESGETGIPRLFCENVSTKKDASNSGYGCYLAYEIATQRCGWQLSAINHRHGAKFIIRIPHSS